MWTYEEFKECFLKIEHVKAIFMSVLSMPNAKKCVEFNWLNVLFSLFKKMLGLAVLCFQYRSINHKVDAKSLRFYRWYYSTACQW